MIFGITITIRSARISLLRSSLLLPHHHVIPISRCLPTFFLLSLTYLAVENFGRCAPMLTQNEEIMARDHLYWFICC